MINSLREVRTSGIQRAQRALDEALEETGELSRDLAHIHRGGLKESQWLESRHGYDDWEGLINYSARGARFELQRGADHAAYIDSLAQLSEEKLANALDSMFDGLQ